MSIINECYYSLYLLIFCYLFSSFFFFFNDTATTEIYTLSLHDALPISRELKVGSLLFLLRPDTERSAKFRVVFQSPPDPATGRRDTGIEFVGVDGFWGVQFPPDRTMWA